LHYDSYKKKRKNNGIWFKTKLTTYFRIGTRESLSLDQLTKNRTHDRGCDAKLLGFSDNCKLSNVKLHGYWMIGKIYFFIGFPCEWLKIQQWL
jgi:hypothetical protein